MNPLIIASIIISIISIILLYSLVKGEVSRFAFIAVSILCLIPIYNVGAMLVLCIMHLSGKVNTTEKFHKWMDQNL